MQFKGLPKAPIERDPGVSRSSLEWEIDNWWSSNLEHFAAHCSNVGSADSPVMIYTDDLKIRMDISEMGIRTGRVGIVSDYTYADLYVFSPCHYNATIHRAVGNGYGFGYTGTLTNLGDDVASIEIGNNFGCVNIVYSDRFKIASKNKKKVKYLFAATLPHFGSIADMVPGSRSGFVPSSDWDKPKVVKTSRDRHGNVHRGGTFQRLWSYRTGVIMTIRSRVEFPVYGANLALEGHPGPQINFHSLVRWDPIARCSVPDAFCNQDGMCIPCEHGDRICHWSVLINEKIARLRVASGAGTFDYTANIGKQYRGQEHFGWAILRKGVMVNPFCYSSTKPTMLTDCHIDSAFILTLFGGVAYEPVQRFVRDIGHPMWVFPCSPYFVEYRGRLCCPITLSPAGCYMPRTGIPMVFPPRVGSFGWLNFLEAAGLRDIGA